MKIIFSHGKESGPWGSKITALANIAKTLGYEVDSIDYRGIESPDERVQKLSDYLQNDLQNKAQNETLNKSQNENKYILVGSSMGGYVSLVCAQQHKNNHNSTSQLQGLFLLAPALYMPNYNMQTYSHITLKNSNTEIIHGWSDDIIPVEHSIKYAQQAQCSLHLIDGDHRLNSSLAQVSDLFGAFLKKLI